MTRVAARAGAEYLSGLRERLTQEHLAENDRLHPHYGLTLRGRRAWLRAALDAMPDEHVLIADGDYGGSYGCVSI